LPPISSVESTGKLVPVEKSTGFSKSEVRTSKSKGKVGWEPVSWLPTAWLARPAIHPTCQHGWQARTTTSHENLQEGNQFLVIFLLGENRPLRYFALGFVISTKLETCF
jgi:hypothetical protein